MTYIKALLFLIIALSSSFQLEAKPSELTQEDVTAKMHEIMRAHVTYKKMSPLLAKRSLDNFITLLDPSKTYFLKTEIAKWLEPGEKLLEQITYDFERSRFPAFEEIFALFRKCILRRNRFEEQLSKQALPHQVSIQELKNMQWADTELALYDKLTRMRAIYVETIAKADGELKELAIQRLTKQRLKNEELFLQENRAQSQQLFCTDLLKAFASSLDSHTVYFTPAEAQQFLISFQQRLVGIGVQLRDDMDGFTIIKIMEGGPSVKELRVKDKIVAIDRVPIIGLDGGEVVERIRGEEGTPVILTIVREIKNGDEKYFETKEIRIIRKEVVIKESRITTSIESFGDGVIANVGLHAFYQDADSSSSVDLSNVLAEIAAKHNVKGVVLDLRSNSGGLLTQAVEVVGLFIKKGVVATIQDENGDLQHLRDLDSKKIWDGPLVVLIDRFSASASEIVAQSLKDYGRALIVGDDHSFGKGTFQVFTLAADSTTVDPQGEYKVTRGRYYTVSGKTPQLVGVQSDIVIPGALTFEEVGEAYTKYPLDNEAIPASFNDSLSDVPFYLRDRIRRIYQIDSQLPIPLYQPYIEQLKKNSQQRISESKGYQAFLSELKNPDQLAAGVHASYDFQGGEAMNLMKDLIWLIEYANEGEKKAA
ncbi:MAG: PDZ domain-containing protein [Verrucomicrobia bacterium]|nr:PDZ domain-containing protein [Verrucomicrobiota bacterium]